MKHTVTIITSIGIIIAIIVDGAYGFPASFALGQDPVQLSMLAMSFLVDAAIALIQHYRNTTEVPA